VSGKKINYFEESESFDEFEEYSNLI
jgi:hypothetical protein